MTETITSKSVLASVILNGQDQMINYTLPVSVTDATGLGGGWGLTITSAQFSTSGTPAHVLSASASKLDTFWPQTSINYPVTITGPALGVGTYQATLMLLYGNGKALHYNTTFSMTQQQLTQVFSTSKTQAPASGGDTFSLSPWIRLIDVLVLLLVGGNIFFWRLVLARSKANNNNLYK